MVKEKIQNIDWKLIAYLAALVFTIGSFYSMMQGKCKEIEANTQRSLENEKSVNSIETELIYIRKGIDRIENKLDE